MPLRSIVAAVAVAAALPVQAQAAAELSEAEIAERVRTVVGWAMERPEAVGLSVAVARGEKVIVDEAHGIADLEWNAPADAATIFRVGSVTKQYTAAAVMKLAEAGKLALDDPIGKHLPDYDTGGRAITVRQLLNHTSGIPNYTAQPQFMVQGAPLPLTDRELLGWVDGVEFDFEPGEGWNYSNTGYYLLGMIVEAASGKSFGAFLQEEFLQPLGLELTRYGSEETIVRGRAQGYGWNAAAAEHVNDALIDMRVPGAAGALSASAGDLVRWQIALVSGRAVSPASYRAMVTSAVPTGQGEARYGFGLMISETDGVERIGHGGGIQGFNSSLTYLPASGLSTAVISNSEALPAAAVEQQIIAALLAADPPPPPRTAPQDGAEEAVRRIVAGLSSGEPDYAMMTPRLAEVTREQLPALHQAFAQLGAVRAVTFAGVGIGGADRYRVELDNGAVDFTIMLNAQGLVSLAALRPVGPPR